MTTLASRPAQRPPQAGVPSGSGSPPEGRRRPSAALDVALAATSLLTLVSYRRVLAGHWVGPVLAVTLAVHLVVGLASRHLRRAWAVVGLGAVVLVLLVAWTVLGATTRYGLPLGRTWSDAATLLARLPGRMSEANVPVPAVHAFLLPAALAAGLMALVGSLLAVRAHRPLLALAPSLALFVTCSCIGTRAWRGPSTAAEAVGLALTAVVAGLRSSQPDAAVWLDPPRPGAEASRGVLAGSLLAVSALVAAVVVGHLPRADGHGVLGWQSAAGSQRIVVSPLVSLRTRLLDPSDAPVFTVRSTVASYWRLTSLDDFDGTEWAAKDTYEETGSALSGLVDLPGSRQVTEQFRIQGLDEAWLPLAFSPERVVGAGSISWDARSGSLLTAEPTSNGLRYTVTSLENLATLSPDRLRAVPAVRASGPLAAYVQLPSGIPARVAALARHIVAHAHNEYDEAIALQDFFYGPTFSYSLHPLSDGTGTSTLETFLFGTRNGYCQQYAGSFAVLARILGLPTRLAVGFTTGTRQADGTYQVSDADAHTWPEVYFPTVGWVPFEPTKGATGHGFAIPGAGAYTGNTADVTQAPAPKPTTATTRPSTTSTTLGRTTPGGTTSTTVSSLPRGIGHRGIGQTGAGPTASGPGRHRRASGGLGTGVWVLVGLAAGAISLVAANVGRRRWRWSRRRRPWPGATPEAASVLAAWDEVQEALSWQGISRLASETQGEFAARVNRRTPFRYLRSATDLDVTPAADLRVLAQLSTEAGFGGRVDAADAATADAAATRIRAALRRRATRWQRLVVLVDPRWAWRTLPAHPG